SLILELIGKRIAPEKIVRGHPGTKKRHDTPESPRSFYELVTVISEKRPIEISIKPRDVHRALLPRSGRTQSNRIPNHLEQSFPVVVPGGVHHAGRAGSLALAHKIDDVL